jgi:predicted nucleic acid-binding protein
MTAFFDTSALIALINTSEKNHNWSLAEFTAHQALGPVVISDIVYAEFSAGMSNQAAVDQVIAQFGLQRASRDDASLFDAGQCFKLYRRKNGPKTNVLPDFFIGAAAKSLGIPLVTANPKDFRKYFTGLKIIHPGGQEVVP